MRPDRAAMPRWTYRSSEAHSLADKIAHPAIRLVPRSRTKSCPRGLARVPPRTAGADQPVDNSMMNILGTHLLILRPLEMSDSNALFDARCDPEVMEFWDWPPDTARSETAVGVGVALGGGNLGG